MTRMRSAGGFLGLMLLASMVAGSVSADDLNPIEQDALTTPTIRRDLLGSTTPGASRLEYGQAQGYRGALATSRFRLDRSGERSDRAVQERLWELGTEQSRIERGLLNIDRLRSTYP